MQSRYWGIPKGCIQSRKSGAGAVQLDRIAQEELKGEGRSEYGTAVIRKLAKELTAEYGKGFDYSSLYKYFRFYKLYPEIVDSVSPQSGALLSWTHYRVLLRVEDKTARDWYTKEAAFAHGRRTARRDWNAERNVLFAAQPK